MNDTSAKADGRAGIVVGVDGSPHSIDALRWSSALVPVLGPLQAVHTWKVPYWAYGAPAPGVLAPLPGPEFQARAERDLEHALSPLDPTLIAERLVCEGSAGPTLVEVASSAELLVVGTRGRNALTDLILGSVSSYCATHSRRTPVAVIPERAPALADGCEVVVGVDGSANATAALRWALTNLPMASILVVGCWGLEVYGGFELAAMPTDELRDGLRDEVHKTVDLVTAQEPRWRDRLRVEVSGGDPRQVLPGRAAERAVLVLGAQGHRGLSGLVLGSVTTALIHRPVVPTIVVPDVDR